MRTLVYIIAAVFLFLQVACKKTEPVQKASRTFKPVQDVQLYKGILERVDSFPSKFIKPRTVDVWLPSDYTGKKKYAVLYMHDGQNLFDPANTLNKQEWRVDEIASELMSDKKTRDFIVVAIWNIPETRHRDYFPEKAFDMLAQRDKDSLAQVADKNGYTLDLQGDEYLRFIVEELKPLVDKEYATLPAFENTFTSGASMGGLISMYALCEYPGVFGGAACISTHWPGVMPAKYNPLPAAIFKYMEAKIPEAGTHKFYFDYGTETLDEHYPQYLGQIDKIFFPKGYSEKDYMNLEFEGADHSEASWNRRFDIPLLYLFKNN